MADSRNFKKYPPILFDEARRREFIDPQVIIDLTELTSGERVADLGAGAGFFTIPVARVVQPKGTVYAVDINPNNLSIIRGKAKHEKVSGAVTLLEGNAETGEGIDIADSSLDTVILSSVLSQFGDKEAVLSVAERLLKPSGELVVTEWHLREMLLGPPPGLRIAKEEVINLLLRGPWHWRLTKDVDAGFYHYCLIFRKDG